MHPDHSSNDNPYFIDTQSGAEMARLIMQDDTVTRNMGGPLSEPSDLSTIHDILDLACGPGSWVLDMAYAHPDKNVIGVDIDPTMVNYARARARSQALDNNAHFQVMNATKQLDFPDNSFDLVNARLLVGFMRPENWPYLIQECRRVSRPGAILRLTESESAVTSGVAYNTLNTLLAQALHAAGQSFSPDGRHFGIVPRLGRLLRDAGYEHIQHKAYAVDFSAGTEAHEAIRQNSMAMLQLIQPFLIRMGVTTQEKVDELYQQAMVEMLSDDFCGIWFFLTVWGKNP